MSWRELFATHIGPGALCGVTLGDWLRLLIRNCFAVDPPYWMRAAMVTGGSVVGMRVRGLSLRASMVLARLNLAIQLQGTTKRPGVCYHRVATLESPRRGG